MNFLTLISMCVLFCVHASCFAKEVRIRLASDFGILDWNNGEVNSLVIVQIMEGLTKLGPRGDAIPAIATSWTSSEDLSKYKFKLNKNAKWSDGKQICAQDFIHAWSTVLSPEFASPYAHLLFDIKNAKEFHRGSVKDLSQLGLQATGCHELQVTLNKSSAFFPALTSNWVLFPRRIDGNKNSPDQPVVGPYKIESWEKDKSYKLTRNKNYYGKSAVIEQLEFLVIPEDSTALTLYETKRLDVLKDFPFLERARLKKRSDYRSFETLVEYHLGFKMDGGLSRDLRCALAHSFDREKIPQLLNGNEIPAYSIVPNSLRKDRLKFQKFKKRTLREKEDVEIVFYSKEIHTPLMEFIASEWKKNLGIEVKLKRMDSKSYWGVLASSPPDLFLSGTTATYPHAYAFLSEFLSGGVANWGKFSSVEYDLFAEKSLSTTRPLVDKSVEILLEKECAVIPLYFRKTAMLISENVRNIWMNPMALIYFAEAK